MRHPATVNSIRGSIAWTNPLRLKISIFPKRETEEEVAAPSTPAGTQSYVIDRDRIFEYVRKHRLPTEADRQFRRDVRNRVDFVSDVRDLQTPSEVWPI